MSPRFVERHGEDLLQQALFEYTRRVSEGVEIKDPPAWVVTCAWNRTKSLLERRDWRPEEVSYEAFGDREDPDTANPEDAFLSVDRRRKIREAVDELPEKHRRLIALSYFEGESVREAARLLRWTPSKAQRAHEAARKKIHEILGVETTDEIEFEFGLIAYLAVAADRGARHALPAGAESLLDHAHDGAHGVIEGADRVTHDARAIVSRGDPSSLPGRLATGAHSRAAADRGPLRRIGDLARRILPGGPGEAGTFLAGEGGTRMVEVCKGLAVCVVGGGALTGAIIGGGHHPRPPRPHAITEAVAVKSGPATSRPTDAAAAADPASFQADEAATGAEAVSPAPRKRDQRPQGANGKAGADEARAVEAATPASGGAEASSARNPESRVEEQFGDIGATEGSPAPTSASADSNPSSPSTPTSSSSTSTSRTSSTHAGGDRGEESGAARRFHGLLE